MVEVQRNVVELSAAVLFEVCSKQMQKSERIFAFGM